MRRYSVFILIFPFFYTAVVVLASKQSIGLVSPPLERLCLVLVAPNKRGTVQ